jgi:hypothetical protein
MITLEIEQLLTDYAGGVRHPEVSGMEHLNLLMIRDRLAALEPQLTQVQRRQLSRFDRMLVAQSHEFLQAIRQIADLAAWREQQQAMPDRWWWYLDVIAYLPLFEAGQFELAHDAPQPRAI